MYYVPGTVLSVLLSRLFWKIHIPYTEQQRLNGVKENLQLLLHVSRCYLENGPRGLPGIALSGITARNLFRALTDDAG